MNKLLLSAISILFLSASARGEDCILSIDRMACPGKEAIALAPYKGENPTVSARPGLTEAQCNETAEQYSRILRLGVLRQINVAVTFGGSALPTVTKTSRCVAGR